MARLTKWMAGCWFGGVAAMQGCSDTTCPPGSEVVRMDAVGTVSEGCGMVSDGAVVRHGQWTVFGDGGVLEVGSYEQGRRQGEFARYRDDGTRLAVGAFRDDRETGRWVMFDKNGLREEEQFFEEGLRHGRGVRLHPDGSVAEEGTYVRGLRQGVWRTRSPAGVVLAEGAYDGDQRDGPWVFRAEDGHVREKGVYRDGQRAGTWTVFRVDGSPAMEQAYKDGAPDGPTLSWHPGGARAEEGHMEGGRRVGTWKRWHPNGQLASEGAYRAGLQEGPWTTFDEQGRVVQQGRYEKGVRRHLWSVRGDDGVVRHQVGELTWVPATGTGPQLALGRVMPDGDVHAIMTTPGEPGRVYWIHRDTTERIPATLVDVLEGHPFAGAHPVYDERMVAVLHPDRPFAVQPGGDDVVLVTAEADGSSPLEGTAMAIGGPSPVVGAQLEALAHEALARTLREARPSFRKLALRFRAVAEDLDLKVRRGRTDRVVVEMRTRTFAMPAGRALVTAQVDYTFNHTRVLGLTLDLLVDHERVTAWDIAHASGFIVGSEAGRPGSGPVHVPPYGTVFDVDNDGRPEVVRRSRQGGVTRLSVHELDLHGANAFPALLSEHFGM